MSEHLTALDATFLELEQADESAHMHIGGILVFDPLPEGGMPSPEQMRQHVLGRMTGLPRYRQRLSEPHTGGLSWPDWEDDPAFDMATHLTSAALPAPGGDGELAAWASGFFSQRLDRHRPLWEMALVEGLSGGRWALAHKTHHCMVDGVGSVDVAHVLLDATPEPGPAVSAPPPLRDGGSDRPPRATLASLAQAWTGRLPVETVVHTAQMGAHGVLHPRDAVRAARSVLALLVSEELHAAPHTSLNVPIGTRRRFEVLAVPLEDLREIKSSLGGTVNDVVLTLVTSGLRALLESRGEPLPSQGMRAMVPMNVRLADERLALGNRVSSLFVELPVAEADTVRRYHQTVARSSSLKSAGQQAAGTSAMIDLAGLAPPVLHAGIAQALYATRLFNVTITNVPGPQHTLYAFGAPLREVHPLVPLAAEHAVGVAAFSYDGTVFFGVVADRDAVPDLQVLLSALRISAEELLAAARPTSSARGRGAPHARRARGASLARAKRD